MCDELHTARNLQFAVNGQKKRITLLERSKKI